MVYHAPLRCVYIGPVQEFAFTFWIACSRVCIVKFSESPHYNFMHPPSRVTCWAPVIVKCTNQEQEYFKVSLRQVICSSTTTHICFWQSVSVTWCAEAWKCSRTFYVILSFKSLIIQIAAEWILVDFQVCSGSNLSSSYPVIYTQSKNNLICFKKMDVNSHSQMHFFPCNDLKRQKIVIKLFARWEGALRRF